MAKTTSFQLSDAHDAFITGEVEGGAAKSASEVMRLALDRYADERRRETALDRALDRALAGRRAPAGVFQRLKAKHGIR